MLINALNNKKAFEIIFSSISVTAERNLECGRGGGGHC